MGILISLIVVIISQCVCVCVYVYTYQIIELYTLNIYNFHCELPFNKYEGKKKLVFSACLQKFFAYIMLLHELLPWVPWLPNITCQPSLYID